MAVISRLMAAALVAAALAAAAAPWRAPRAAVVSAFLEGSGRGAGLHAVVAGRVTIKLLPRPRLQATDLSISAEDGAVLLDAPVLKADIDIPSMLGGAWRMASATLVEPTLTIDVDRLAARAAEHAPSSGPTLQAPDIGASSVPAGAATEAGPPIMMHLRSGLLRTRSASGFADLLATAVDASATWSGDGLVISGTATLRGNATQFTGALQRPALSLTAAGSPASLQLASAAFDFSADGILSDGVGTRGPGGGGSVIGGRQPQFVGRASLATTSLPRLLRTLDDAPFPLGSKHAQVSGDLVARPHELSLSNARLRLDRTRLEGTLAWRRDGLRGLLAGTLATDLLDAGALAGVGTGASELDGLYREALAASPLGIDVDLRVSATAARLGRVALEDAAFGALVRGDRLELTMDEASAYSGLVKARAIVALSPGGIDAHAELSAKQIDLGAMSEGLSGRASVGGSVTAHAALDGHGPSLRAVVSDLAGTGHVGIEGARVVGLSLVRTLRRLGHRSPIDAERRGAPTVFDPVQWDVSIRDGVLQVPRGRLTAPGVALDFDARTGLSDGRVDLHAVAMQADDKGAPTPDGAVLPLELRGFWSGPLSLMGGQPGRPGSPDVPATTLPRVDSLGAGR